MWKSWPALQSRSNKVTTKCFCIRGQYISHQNFHHSVMIRRAFLFLSFFFLLHSSAVQKKPPQLSLSSALHFIAYWYSLWTSRWKVPHLHPLFMVINRLSVDPECLNLTQKCLTSLICFCSCLCQHYIHASTWAEREINKGYQQLCY